jgi:hypothetical protein
VLVKWDVLDTSTACVNCVASGICACGNGATCGNCAASGSCAASGNRAASGICACGNGATCGNCAASGSCATGVSPGGCAASDTGVGWCFVIELGPRRAFHRFQGGFQQFVTADRQIGDLLTYPQRHFGHRTGHLDAHGGQIARQAAERLKARGHQAGGHPDRERQGVRHVHSLPHRPPDRDVRWR